MRAVRWPSMRVPARAVVAADLTASLVRGRVRIMAIEAVRGWCGTRGRTVGFWLAAAVGLVVLASIWAPVVLQYRVPGLVPDMALLDRGSSVPGTPVLEELGRFRVLHPLRDKESELAAAAELGKLLDGRVTVEGNETIPISVEFAPADLTTGSGLAQLYVAALVIPDRLLKAYEATGERALLQRALRYVEAWHEFESGSWLPRGAMWDDHAAAERVFVLVDLWRALRASGKTNQSAAVALVAQLRRAAALLAKPGMFNYATNHGVMQNLALLHFSTALPWTPEAERHRALALDRLTRQMRFFISDEGVVLESSPGYHLFGQRLLGFALRYAAIGGFPVPPDWQVKFDRGARFTALLRRPDGSLPRIGDTDAEAKTGLDQPPAGSSPAETAASADRPDGFYPLSGYALWWHDRVGGTSAARPAQLVTTWSDFPGHGHRRANQLSVTFWGAGRNWWSDVGYWPYSNSWRLVAESWAGSGAPHVAGEHLRSDQSVTVPASADENGLRFLELQRSTGEGVRVIRQIIELDGTVWLVIDSGSDPRARELVVNWTAEPDLAVTPGAAPGIYRLADRSGAIAMDLVLGGTPGNSIARYRGSQTPFAGWIVRNGVPVPAESLRVSGPAGSGAAFALWTLASASDSPTLSSPTHFKWTDASHWSISFRIGSRQIALTRDSNAIDLDDQRWRLSPGPDVEVQKQAIREALRSLAADSPRFQAFLPWRERVSRYLAVLLLTQTIVLGTAWRFWPKACAVLSGLAAVGWAALACILHLVYFAN